MKVFISQPMRGRTTEEIEEDRLRAIQKIQLMYPDEDIKVLDTLFKDTPNNVDPLWFLGESIKILSQAKIAYFVNGWRRCRGCKIEYQCCGYYGIKIIEED